MPELISDEEMKKLKVIDIGPSPSTSNLTRGLCYDRGINLRALVDGKKIFIDDDLGYLILNENLLDDRLTKYQFEPYAREHGRIYSNWRASVARNSIDRRDLDKTSDWYVEEAGGWPEEAGEGITVAVVDDGIDPELGLLQRPEDFGSCIETNRLPGSLNHHGSNCAGAIAAKGRDNRRMVPAPNCRIVAAQAMRGGANTAWLVDLLLMLSWAVGCKQAKIVNMSFWMDAIDIEKSGGQYLLSRIAKQLRQQNRALLFAAVDYDKEKISYPASLDGFVAVASYLLNDDHRYQTMTGYDPSWLRKEELLFAPETVRTYDEARFGGSSASCAYMSGVAALYIQRYLGRPHETENRVNTLDDVLRIIRTRAKRLNSCEKSIPQYAVQLPSSSC